MDNDLSTQALAVTRPLPLGQLKEFGRMAAVSHYFRTASTLEQAAMIIKAGHELGIPEVSALQSIYFVDGKITLSATLMAALIQKSDRFTYRVRRKDAQVCTIEFFEHGESVGVESFTLEEAKTADLYPKKDNWRKYPKAMLFNRCMSNGAKTYCPAVFAGQIVYTPDEVNPDLPINPETGEIIDAAAVEVPSVPLATVEQKQQIQAWFREHKMRGPAVDAWLAERSLPPVSQMTAIDGASTLNLMRAFDTPPSEPEPAQEPDPAEADVPAA